jgi:hypothetical protein
VVVVLGGRVMYLFVTYVLGATSTQRFHVESAAVAFVAGGASSPWRTAVDRGVNGRTWFNYRFGCGWASARSLSCSTGRGAPPEGDYERSAEASFPAYASRMSSRMAF